MSNKIIFPKSDSVDIMLFSEGTYPYIKGGVSSWILQLMKGLPEFTFGVCFIGAQDTIDGKKMKISYEFPPNLKHLEVHYLFDNKDMPTPKKIEGDEKGFEAIHELHAGFKKDKFQIPKMLQDISFYTQDVTFEDFLFSKRAWQFIDETYSKNCPDVPFIDYFWTLRNIHKPIWLLANIVDKLPKTKIYHSPSTGYAGFLGALASYHANKPFFLTEHGIYTRERKIDMFSADWIEFKKPSLLQQPEEYNYIKRMWVNFFDKIGLFCYNRSNYTFSLFSGAQRIQISYGADENKSFVIPNGVDVEGLGATIKERLEVPKPIITLIGRVVPIKDIKTFIRAIKIASITIPDIEGWIVGPVEEDMEYLDECQQMAISLGLKQKKQMFNNNKSDLSLDELVEHRDKIKFFGHSNIKEILPKSALQTLSSISEGMPLVILEGFAAGVPCVATDVGSCRDLIEGGIDDADKAIGLAGAITGIANPEALADEYIKFLTFENGLWKKAQEAGLNRVKEYYSQNAFLHQYKELYDEAKELTWEELSKRVCPYYMPKQVPYPKVILRRFPIVKFLTNLQERSA
ncbi:GT4 family glycosyltransferase PelF [Sulfurimonas sp. C5]|uniref:GT4 family glycosyltransferase PelF n=1 Tax=Sulfurimonas sp. C5 TaxID=3036947 RepID=UPI002456B441|nr:GT4 family glycosyltransferase PelF [Sulfurimonas sp. C5]MDH4944737.1 GT4 family glycosyltransferase PelF [Sulfurimonas sp. C5]